MISSPNRRMPAAALNSAQKSALAFAAAIAVAGPETAYAIDINAEPGLITETVATRDRLKYYDNRKIYGAEAVGERPRVYAMPDGLRWDQFLVFPWIEEGIVYDSNIFGSSANPEADWRSELKAAVSATSQFPRHQLIFNIDAGLYNYFENTDQDHTNGGAHVRTSIDIDHANAVSASLHSELKHEDRTSSTANFAAAEPVPVWRNAVSAGFTHDVGKLYGTISATAESRNYFSVKALDGSTLNQDFRDQEMYSGTLRWGYRYSPGYEWLGKLRALQTANDGDAKTDRDATGYEAATGISFETNPLWHWQLIGGYGIRDYDRPDLETLATYLAEAQVKWIPTQRLTLYGLGRRTIDDELGSQDGGRISTTAEFRAEYEIYHNLIAVATAGATQGEFLGLNRTDVTYSAGAELQYYYTKNMLLTLGYDYDERDSSNNDADMTRHQVSVRGRLRF